HHSDGILRRLRTPGETGYKIPRGGLFERVSCANYFGEIIEWCGWAIATWSLPGLAFAVWTAANLVPRARAHHKWYPSQFPDYPQQRRALIPFVF
ncbi:MAG: 3-oxo-5-alpha-steroid 4-dehydrogenase, partial [Dehalococcoidia bacterium]